jgi:hypothetical protein
MPYIYCNKEQRDIITGIKRKIKREKLNKKDDSTTSDADVMDYLLKEAKILPE